MTIEYTHLNDLPDVIGPFENYQEVETPYGTYGLRRGETLSFNSHGVVLRSGAPRAVEAVSVEGADPEFVPEPQDYRNMSKTQLQAELTRRGIDYASRWTKVQLMQKLWEDDGA